MKTGVVRWFNKNKGYGFITDDETGKDIFIHYSGIAGDGFKNLEQGQRVKFNTQPDAKGEKAVDTEVIG